MLTTSTHDTKRSEDVRNRLNVLSEIPATWSTAIRRWQRMNANRRRTLPDGRIAPDPNEEYLLYQTIVGVWPWRTDEEGCIPSLLTRLQEYSTKALSEAKINLSWISPDPEYIGAVHGFLADLLLPDARGRRTPFVQSLERLMPQLRLFGGLNSLAQLVLKATSPGVPDFYQGTELWDLSLVDPDNRRPVDYDERSRLLQQLDAIAEKSGARAVASQITRELSDGAIKLWTTAQLLRLRQAHAPLFRDGGYVPIYAGGPAEQHVIAHARQHEGTTVLVLVPRFASSLMKHRPELPMGAAWNDWELILPPGVAGSFHNIFTGDELSLSDPELALSEAFAHFPVAVLVQAKAMTWR